MRGARAEGPLMFPLADTAKEKGPAAVTKSLIAANLAVFGWEVWLSLSGGTRALDGFIGEHALVARRMVQQPLSGSQWQTVATHLFLHGGILHVLGNVWFLWIFGGNVEGRLGWFRYLAFYALAGLAAAATQIATEPGSAVPMIGASGAISGVLGAFLVLFPTAFVWTLIPWVVPIVPVPAVVFLIVWFVMQAYNSVGALLGTGNVEGGVAWAAHAGGFAAGVAMMLYARRMKWVGKR